MDYVQVVGGKKLISGEDFRTCREGAWMYGGFLRIFIMLLLYFMSHVEAKRCKLMQQV